MAGLAFTAEQYCDDVLGGRVVANRWVRLACERHRRDLVEIDKIKTQARRVSIPLAMISA